MTLKNESSAELQQAKDALRQGDVQTAEQLVTAFLSVHPSSKEAKEMKAEIARRKKILNTSATGPLKARQIACANCGKPVSVSHTDTQAVVCGQCRTINHIQGSEVMNGGKNPKDYAPFSFVRLGMIAHREGKKYEVVARMRIRTYGTEWDDEDNIYTRLNWTSDEWLLSAEDGSQLYLYEDKEGNYEMSRAFVPDNPSIPSENDESLQLKKSQRPQRILERGTAEILFLEGEFSWKPTVGDKSGFAEYRADRKGYSLEWHQKEGSKEIEEVEFFESTEVTKLALLQAFKLEKEVEALRTQTALQKEYRTWAIICFIAAAALLFIGLSQSSSGKVVFRHSENIETIDDDGVTVGPFELKNVGRVHQLVLQGTVSDNAWNWAGVELLDAQQEPINAMEESFWHESGHDDEGPWSESLTQATRSFQLQNAGQYYARIFGEVGTSGGTVTLFVTEEVSLMHYFFLSSVILLFYGISLYYFRRANPLWIFATPWAIVALMNQYSD
jgi:hypothetical protein